MTTHEEICNLLVKSARKTTVADLLAPFLLWLIYFISAQILFVILDHQLLFSNNARLTAFSLTFLPPLHFLFYARKRSKQKLSLVYIAQQLEKLHPSLSHRLVSYLLSSHKESHATIELMTDIKSLTLVPYPANITFRLRTVCLLLFCGLFYSILSPQPSLLSLTRLYAPTLEAPLPTKTQISSIQAEQFSANLNNNWRLVITTTGIAPKNGFIRIHKNNKQSEDIELIKIGHGKFYCPLRNMDQELDYSGKIGDTYIKRQKISLK